MLKKLSLLLFATLLLAGCKDDKAGFYYAKTNNAIENGSLTGTNLHFYGTATVTDAQNRTFTTPKTWFEFAGLSNDFTLYMHKMRFASDMPRLELRLHEVPYTPESDKALVFSEQEIIPQALTPNEVGGGSSYQPATAYRITDLEGSIDDINCRITFTCADTYHVTYEGRLVILE